MEAFRKNRNLLHHSFAAAVFAAAVYYYFSHIYDLSFIQDDAYTALRYVKNFLTGKGLVFNPGEHVEGYTSFLWVMLLSLSGLLKFNLVDSAHTLSVFFGAANLALVFIIGLSASRANYYSVLAAFASLALSFTGGYIYWAASGMETSLFIFLILLTMLLYISDKKIILSSVLALLSLCRPEGVFISLLIFTDRLIGDYLEYGGNLKAYKKSLKLILIYSIPILIYLVFRISYYGYLFPNTFYAKTSFSIRRLEFGINYFLTTLRSYLLYGIVIALPVYFSFNNFGLKKWRIYLTVVVPYLLSVIIIGGDILPLHRFFLPVLPLLYMYFINSLTEIKIKTLKSKKNIQITAVFIFILILILNYNYELPKIYNWRGYELGLVGKMKAYADWVNLNSERTGKRPAAALSTIGAFSYYADADVIDIIGLTDEYIAHNPVEVEGIAEQVDVLWKERHYNAGYVLSRKPDFIIFPAGAKPSAFPEAALFSKCEFLTNYYPQLFFNDNFDQFLPVFTRRENPIRNISETCNATFTADYISANNIFLKNISALDDEKLNLINRLSKKMISKCRLSATYAYALSGYSYFHAGRLDSAEAYLLKSLAADSMNSISIAYLMNLYTRKNDKAESIKYIRELKNISPDALPSLKGNSDEKKYLF